MCVGRKTPCLSVLYSCTHTCLCACVRVYSKCVRHRCRGTGEKPVFLRNWGRMRDTEGNWGLNEVFLSRHTGNVNTGQKCTTNTAQQLLLSRMTCSWIVLYLRFQNGVIALYSKILSVVIWQVNAAVDVSICEKFYIQNEISILTLGAISQLVIGGKKLLRLLAEYCKSCFYISDM